MAKVTICKPKDYGEGAWRVEADLTDSERGDIERTPVPFKLPKLKARSILADKGYKVAVPQESGGAELQGAFVNGRWEGHVYTNGVSEADNPTPLQDVADALVGSINEAVEVARKWNEAVTRFTSGGGD